MSERIAPATAQEQIAAYDRQLAEIERALADAATLRVEGKKLQAEGELMIRQRFIAPWQTVLLALGAGAGLYDALLLVIGA